MWGNYAARVDQIEIEIEIFIEIERSLTEDSILDPQILDFDFDFDCQFVLPDPAEAGAGGLRHTPKSLKPFSTRNEPYSARREV